MLPRPSLSRRSRGLRGALSILLLLGAVSAPAHAQAPARKALETLNVLNVLFIGNSYTAANNLAELVAAIAGTQPGSPALVPTLALRGGATLDWHALYGPAPGALLASGLNAVVLQEQSLLGAGDIGGDDGGGPTHVAVADPAAFHAAVRGLVKRIRARGATPMLLMTWARRDWPEDLEKLESAYMSIGRELRVKVAPVGTAWAEAQKRLPGLDLYARDGAHPNGEGSYLAACVIAATLTGRDPRGASSTITGHFVDRRSGEVDLGQTITLVEINPQTAAQLQAIAWETVSRKP